MGKAGSGRRIKGANGACGRGTGDAGVGRGGCAGVDIMGGGCRCGVAGVTCGIKPTGVVGNGGFILDIAAWGVLATGICTGRAAKGKPWDGGIGGRPGGTTCDADAFRCGVGGAAVPILGEGLDTPASIEGPACWPLVWIGKGEATGGAVTPSGNCGVAPDDDLCTAEGRCAGVDGACPLPLGIRGIAGVRGFSLCGASALSCAFGVDTAGTGNGAGEEPPVGTGAGVGSVDLTLNFNFGPGAAWTSTGGAMPSFLCAS
jgi:hypothetical protein